MSSTQTEDQSLVSPPIHRQPLVAYFSMEMALEPSIPTYSGGLGMLAGDTIRSAADLRVPMVGVTLLYRKGYFYQQLDASGWQTEQPRIERPAAPTARTGLIPSTGRYRPPGGTVLADHRMHSWVLTQSLAACKRIGPTTWGRGYPLLNLLPGATGGNVERQGKG